MKTLTLDCGGGVKMEFVLIPAGRFTMGSNEYAGSKPPHEVRIGRPFYLGKFEVTQEQWQAVMGSNPSRYKGDSNLPVESESWKDCQAFCKKLSSKMGKSIRLQTEAEWEYACRAGSSGKYCFGDGEDELGQYAWYYMNSGGKTHAVGGKQANAWGLYDMHGNVWEWCEEAYHENYTGAPTDGSAWTSGGNQSFRVMRGGSWDLNPWLCRSANRLWCRPGTRYNNIGLRVAVGTQ